MNSFVEAAKRHTLIKQTKVHDAGEASHIENITNTPRPSSAIGATGETIS